MRIVTRKQQAVFPAEMSDMQLGDYVTAIYSRTLFDPLQFAYAARSPEAHDVLGALHNCEPGAIFALGETLAIAQELEAKERGEPNARLRAMHGVSYEIRKRIEKNCTCSTR